MRLYDYIEQVRLHIQGYLPKEIQDAELLIRLQRKNNELLLHGLSFKLPDQKICPVLYLENYYQIYQNGTGIEDTFYRIGRDYISALKSINEQEIDLSYDCIKSDIVPCVVNADKNWAMLKSVPHQKVEDLAVVYRIMIHGINNETGSILLNNSMLTVWGIKQKDLHDQALQNMGHVFTLKFQPMETVIAKLLGFPFPGTVSDHNESGMFVLTNSEEYYGASYLCCPDILNGISKRIKGNFLILPSSVNELIIIKKRMK